MKETGRGKQGEDMKITRIANKLYDFFIVFEAVCYLI